MCSPSAMVRQIDGIFCDRALPAEDRPRRTHHAQSALVTPLGVNSRAVAVAAANKHALPLTRAQHALPEAVQG